MGALATEALLSDRLEEFKLLASRKEPSRRTIRTMASERGTSSAAPAWLLVARGRSPWKAEGGEKERSDELGRRFMREFFKDCAEIQKMLSIGHDGVRALKAVLLEAVSATTREAQKNASDDFAATSQETTACVSESKRALEVLKSRAEAEEQKQGSKHCSSERRIQANMQQALARKHQQLLLDFQKAQLEYKAVLQRQEEREMRLLCPDSSDEDLHQMIEAGENRVQIVTRKLAGAHGLIFDEIQRIQDKHQDILQLERSCEDLAQMFQEVAVLVDAQGELLDNIEEHVHSAKDNTAQAVKELQVAQKVQGKNRKWMCYLMVFLAFVALIVLLPVLLKVARKI